MILTLRKVSFLLGSYIEVLIYRRKIVGVSSIQTANNFACLLVKPTCYLFFYSLFPFSIHFTKSISRILRINEVCHVSLVRWMVKQILIAFLPQLPSKYIYLQYRFSFPCDASEQYSPARPILHSYKKLSVSNHKKIHSSVLHQFLNHQIGN